MSTYEITTGPSNPIFRQGLLPFAYIDEGVKTNNISQVKRIHTVNIDSQYDPVHSILNLFSGVIVMSEQESRPIGEIFPQDLIKKGKGSRC